MSETFLYMICMLSMMMSLSSLYLALSLAKSVKIAHQQLQQLYEILFQLPPGGEYYVQYEDEEEEIPPATYNNKDGVINMFSKRPMRYDEVLGAWVEVD